MWEMSSTSSWGLHVRVCWFKVKDRWHIDKGLCLPWRMIDWFCISSWLVNIWFFVFMDWISWKYIIFLLWRISLLRFILSMYVISFNFLSWFHFLNETSISERFKGSSTALEIRVLQSFLEYLIILLEIWKKIWYILDLESKFCSNLDACPMNFKSWIESIPL